MESGRGRVVLGLGPRRHLPRGPGPRPQIDRSRLGARRSDRGRRAPGQRGCCAHHRPARPALRTAGANAGHGRVGGTPREQHGLPGAILADLLRVAGFEPLDLGANTPALSFAQTALGADRVVAVLIGATTQGREAAVRKVVLALRKAEVAAPVLLGGPAIVDADHARKLGADGFSGHDAIAAVAAVEAAARFA